MPGKQAKLLTDVQIMACLKALQNRRHSVRNIAMLLLSTKAGLRAGEIAGLTWPMVSDSSGKIGKVIAVENRIAKKGSGRIIPMHAELRDVLIQLRLLSEPQYDAVIRSERRCAMSASSVANWFSDLYLAADNYLGRLSDNYDGRYDCPLGPDIRRGGAPTGDRPQRAAA